MITLEMIRFKIEQRVKDTIENDDVIDWSNEAQSEFALSIEIPGTYPITVNTTDLVYAEPTGLKRINRMRLQSEQDLGVDRDIPFPYRRYAGNIIFQNRLPQDDTLNVDYYRHLTYFTDISDSIDLEDRSETLYTTYGVAQYYSSPRAIERFGDVQAKRQYDTHYGRYTFIKDQIATQYVMDSQPSTIKEVF